MAEEVGVPVGVSVGVSVTVNVEVEVAVWVDAGRVEVEVLVAGGIEVGPPAVGKPVFVAGIMMIFVDVGLAVCGGLGVLVFTGVLVRVPVGKGVRVVKDAPGVRKTSIQTGLVRMAGSRGSMKLMGWPVRKSTLGLRFEFMLAGSLQLGAKRSAHPLARMMQMSPNSRISRIRMIESRPSRSRVCMETSLDGETDIYGGARVGMFVVTRALKPDASVMRVDDTT